MLSVSIFLLTLASMKHGRFRNGIKLLLGGICWGISLAISGAATSGPQGLMKSEFIFESAPFPECHAATIAETKETLVAAWFGGTRERHPDVGIWLSRQIAGHWSVPVEVANGLERGSKRYTWWDPGLLQP